VIYSIGVSLDGFVAGPNGEIDWSAPDEELHRSHNEQTKELGVELCGRRLYEVMLPWESDDPSAGEPEREFARLWQNLPKIVFSTTLDRVEGNARLATDGIAAEVAKLKEQPGKDIAVGGPTLAASFTASSSARSCSAAAPPTSRRSRTASTSSCSRREPSAPVSSTSAIAALASEGGTPRQLAAVIRRSPPVMVALVGARRRLSAD